MKIREFIDKPNNTQNNIGASAVKGISAIAGIKPTTKITTPGTQPKDLTISADPTKSNQPAAGSQSTQVDPNVKSQMTSQQQAQQQKVEIDTKNAQMKNDAMVLAKRIGMNPQQADQFAQKVLGTGTKGSDIEKTLSPQDLQKAMPKPGGSIDVQKIGQTKILPTPGDQKGIKLDTTKQLGYPVIVDPRDLR